MRPLHIVGVFKAEYYGIRVCKRNLRADRKRAVSVVNSLHRVGGCKTPVDVFVLDTRQNKLVCPDVARVRHRLRELIHQYRGRVNFGYLNFHFLHGYEEFLVDRVVRARGIPSFVCRVDVELNAVRDGHGGIVAARRAVRGHRHRVRTVRVRRVAYLELRVSARRRVAYLDVDILVFRRRNLVAEEAVDNVEAYVVAVERVVRKAAVVFELLVRIILEYGNLNKLFGNRELERTVFGTVVVVPEIVFGVVRVGYELYRYGIGIDVCRREFEVLVVARGEHFAAARAVEHIRRLTRRIRYFERAVRYGVAKNVDDVLEAVVDMLLFVKLSGAERSVERAARRTRFQRVGNRRIIDAVVHEIRLGKLNALRNYL